MTLSPQPLDHRLPSRAPWALGGVPSPVAGPGVCSRCHGPSTGGTECWCCRRVGRLLGEAPGAGPTVVPIALCRPGDVLHGALRRYKDAPALSARDHYAGVLGGVLRDFLARHRRCLEAVTGQWDAAALVPSSSRAPRPAAASCPFEAVARRVPELGALTRVTLERAGGRTDHLRPALDAYVVGTPGRPPRPLRVLMLDDTWVTGARARSAAAAVAAAGSAVVAIVVVGRTVDPLAAPRLARWWERHASAHPTGLCCAGGCGQGPRSALHAARLWSNAVQSG